MNLTELRKIVLSFLIAFCILLSVHWLGNLKILVLTGISMILFGLIIIYRHNHNNFKDRAEPDPDLYNKIESLINIRNELDVNRPLPHLDGFALSPIVLDELINILIEKDDLTIVEFGSGSSTVVLAGMLQKLNRGTIYSFDHLLKYTDQTKKMLKQRGYDNYANVFHAPLETQQFNGESFNWYDIELNTIVDEIDILVVDGPPGRIQEKIRQPALFASAELLAEESWIVVDDTYRKDEQEIVDEWLDKNEGFERVPICDSKATLLSSS